jgi:O-antigen biosynthesis protein
LARGKCLLLMNSDVFPKSAGWLSKLHEIYKTETDAGILGVKLLFEDGSIQHAGMELRRYPPWGGLWINHHTLKGHSAAGLSGVRDVAAVTAACMMVDAELYRSVGGLCEDYIIGDFEDSDLCLKVRQAGRRNLVALDVELYHVERQSQNRIDPLLGRTNLTLYNCWLHNSRWHDVISDLRE